MNFHVGQKVVCINDIIDPARSNKYSHLEILPALNSVYTIRDVGNDWLRLVEITNPILPYLGEYTELKFFYYRFRPLVERKSSIELLTSIKPDTPIVGSEIERERFKKLEQAISNSSAGSLPRRADKPGVVTQLHPVNHDSPSFDPRRSISENGE